ncbi:MAG: T9SS type A sorting domain-containing protein [Cyclobacteriaceae bacterium]
MKNFVITIITLFVTPVVIYAQWSSGSGGDIYYNGGEVGIGTSSPSSTLHISESLSAEVMVTSTGTTTGNISSSITPKYAGATNFGTFLNTSQGNMYFQFNSSTKFTMLSNGYLGIGTSTPTVGLEINKPYGQSSVKITGTGFIGDIIGSITTKYAGASNFGTFLNTSQGNFVFSTGSTTTMTVFSDGNVTIPGDMSCDELVETSDIRKKTNIKEDNLSHTDLYKLKTYRYTFKDDISNRERIGLMAQELQEYYPEVVYGSESEGFGVSYTKLIPLLIRALQDQNHTIVSLQEKIELLEESSQTIQSQSLFSVYPNPTDKGFKITLVDSGSPSAKFEITNLNGDIVASYPAEGLTSIDLSSSNLAKGVYFVRYSDDRIRETQRIVISR